MQKESVTSLEKEAFKRRLLALAGQKSVSDGEFADAVYTALSRFGVDETRFRDMFGLTKGAVERWTTLKNLPQPEVRSGIISWIHQQL